MSVFKIRPWPFNNNEVVELYWLCSPYMNQNRDWILKAVFKNNSKVKVVELPWGTLPYLRLGRYYKNGSLFNTYKRGSLGEVIIEKEQFEICPSFDMPSILYYFYKNAEFGIQKVCKFTIGGIIYFIPCIEIVRSFFAKSKTLANYILKPNGLDFLIDKSKLVNKCLYISLSIEVPEKMATREMAAILGWIKYNNETFKEWCAVYSNIFDDTILKNRLIELLPPVRENCTWNYRGIRSDNYVLILELSETSSIKTPFEHVKFTHPSIKRNRITEVVDKIRNSRKGKDIKYEMLEDEDGIGTRMEQKQPVIEVAPTKFLFENIRSIEKMAEVEREIFIGTKIIPNGNSKTGNGENIVKVSTEDWSAGGKIAPIEFKSLEMVKGKKGKGLEDFYKTILYIKDNYKQYDISMTEVFLPEGKSFSHYPDGDRRNCAIVKIVSDKIGTSYILEIGRYDDWSISTLVIKYPYIVVNSLEFEADVELLLHRLIIDGGHWTNKPFNAKYRVIKLKHYNLSSTNNIINKIINIVSY